MATTDLSADTVEAQKVATTDLSAGTVEAQKVATTDLSADTVEAQKVKSKSFHSESIEAGKGQLGQIAAQTMIISSSITVQEDAQLTIKGAIRLSNVPEMGVGGGGSTTADMNSDGEVDSLQESNAMRVLVTDNSSHDDSDDTVMGSTGIDELAAILHPHLKLLETEKGRPSQVVDKMHIKESGADSLNVKGKSVFSGAVEMMRTVKVGGSVDVGGAIAIAGTLEVDDTANIDGNLSVGGAVNVKGDTRVRGGLEVNEHADFKSDVYVGASLTVHGTVVGSGPYVDSSDARFKTNIVALSPSTADESDKSEHINETNQVLLEEGALEKVLRLQGVAYDLKTDEYPERRFSTKRQVGFIADEVEQVIPELVDVDRDGYRTVAYSRSVAYLVEAIKELQQQVLDLKKEVQEMKRSA